MAGYEATGAVPPVMPSTFARDGRVGSSNNAAERAPRGIALGRTSRLFCGSDRDGDGAAFMSTPIDPAKSNGVDPQAWLADVLVRIADTPLGRLTELQPRSWRSEARPTAIGACPGCVVSPASRSR